MGEAEEEEETGEGMNILVRRECRAMSRTVDGAVAAAAVNFSLMRHGMKSRSFNTAQLSLEGTVADKY